jgi:hypothetical protein
MVRKSSPGVFRGKELSDLINGLEQNHKYRKWISDMEAVLLENLFSGDLVEKKKIPDYYVDKYGLNNLYGDDHSEGYRS